jgi:PiT family inorganic phosphate transporter
LVKIVSTWVVCPVLAAVFAAAFYLLARKIVERWPIHLLEQDAATRACLIAAGAFGAYSLGANNIANVMGVFVPAFPAGSIEVFGVFGFTSAQLLFLVGGLAIAVGVFSYSYRVMMTVGKGLFKLTPVTALVVVLAEAIVLFLFASQSLESWLAARGLPTIPLVPVSSSQAVIGAVIGIALVKGGRGVRYIVLGKVAGGWAATPAIAALLAFFGLFFLQNVFGVTVARPVPFAVNEVVLERLADDGVASLELEGLGGSRFATAREFAAALEQRTSLGDEEKAAVLEYARLDSFLIDPATVDALDGSLLSPGQIDAVRSLSRKTFSHDWQLREELAREDRDWRGLPDEPLNREHNKALAYRLRYVYDSFRVPLWADGR